MNSFRLVTEWHLDAPIETVWAALYDAAAWPGWWKYVQRVEELNAGDSTGVGAVRRYTWSSRLPYHLTFEMTSTRIERPCRLEGRASGQLEGEGRWELWADGLTTYVRYNWEVAVTRTWMRALAPILAPAFSWNHAEVMAAGGKGIAAYLGVKLLSSGRRSRMSPG